MHQQNLCTHSAQAGIVFLQPGQEVTVLADLVFKGRYPQSQRGCLPFVVSDLVIELIDLLDVVLRLRLICVDPVINIFYKYLGHDMKTVQEFFFNPEILD